ncbi:MAG: vWA domain-containing protein, partial [archaeon]
MYRKTAAIGIIITLVLIISSAYSQAVQTYTLDHFYDDGIDNIIHFPLGGGSDISTKIRLPRNSAVVDSRIDIEGLPLATEIDSSIDAILVTDVSGSMGVENKLTEAKNSSVLFIDMAIYDGTLNNIGLVSYSNYVKSLSLTKDKTALKNELNSYVALG